MSHDPSHRTLALALALLAGGCAAPLDGEADSPVNFPPIVKLPPVLLGPVFVTRNRCTVAAGGNITSGFEGVQGGLPAPETSLGYNCVESASAGNSSTGVVTVDVDNPRIYTRTALGSYTLKDGSHRPCELASNQGGTVGTFCDLSTTVSGGDAPPPGFLAGGSVPDLLFPVLAGSRTHAGAGDDDQPTVRIDGLRVGYSRLDTQLNIRGGDNSHFIDGWPTSVTLNPNVLLVPIEAVEIDGPSQKSQSGDRDSALATFDRVPSVDDVQGFSDGYGDLEAESRASFHRVYDGSDGRGRFGNFVVPDDVWVQCGIQFRLVNHFVMQTDDYHALPPNLTPASVLDDHQPFEQNRDQAQADRRHLQTVPQVLFPERCSFGDSPLIGTTDVYSKVACAGVGTQSRIPDYVLSHELGHLLGLPEGYSSTGICTVPGDPRNLMCLAGGYDLTADQCTQARQTAQSIIDSVRASGHGFYKPGTLVSPGPIHLITH